ncbi:hypothetical protein DFH06DRAFT_1303637 [Mycena polygramma]|nr:hypothetical protein DFH06DRAFT_1303637 [Mycena polygramma]
MSPTSMVQGGMVQGGMVQGRSPVSDAIDTEVNKVNGLPCEYPADAASGAPSSHFVRTLQRDSGCFFQTEVATEAISLQARTISVPKITISIPKPTIILSIPEPAPPPRTPVPPTTRAPTTTNTLNKTSSTKASSALSIPHITAVPTSSLSSTSIDGLSAATPTTFAPTSPAVSTSESSLSSVQTSLAASSVSSDRSLSPAIIPAPTLTGPTVAASAQPRKSFLSPGIIAGISCGILALLLIISISVVLFIRRRNRNKSMLQPVVQVESVPRPIVREAIAGKRTGAMTATIPQANERARDSSDAAERRQQFITQRIMTVQGELAALAVSGDAENNALRRQIEMLQHRIRTLESELQSQWALGLSDETPPGYIP